MSKPRKLKSGRWQIRFFNADGERVAESFATYDLARTALRNREVGVETQIEQRARFGSSAMTVDEAAKVFFASMRRDPNNTQRRFDKLVNGHRKNYELHIKPHLETTKLADLTPARLRKWVEALAATKAARRGQKNESGHTIGASRIRSITTTLRQIAKANDIPLVVMLADTLKQKRKRKRPRALQTIADVRALLAACRDEWFRVAAAIACHTGARLGEVASLRWRHIGEGAITLELSWDGPLKARYEDDEDAARVVPIGAELVALLDAWRAVTNGGADDHVVLFAGKRPLREGHDEMADRTRKACRSAGLVELTFHQLRHTYGTVVSDQGLPIAKLQALLGHADVKTTSIYINPDAASATSDPRARLGGTTVAPTSEPSDQLPN